jgi:hypothetical protein
MMLGILHHIPGTGEAHWNQVGTPSMTLRTPQQVARYLDGLELLPPGVVSCSRWRPRLTSGGALPAEVDEFCGVAPQTLTAARRGRAGAFPAGSLAQRCGSPLSA